MTTAAFRKRQIALPALTAFLLLAALAVSLWQSHRIAALVLGFSAHLHALGPLGWLIFTAAIAGAALIGIVPGALLGLAAGAVYGIVTGFLTSAVGILAGAIIAFALSRSTMRPLIASLVNRSRRITAFDTLLTAGSWRIVALLRVSPIMPFSLTSYALGLSGITARAYFIGTLAAMPALLGYVIIGALGTSTLTTKSTIHLAILLLGAAATLALSIHLTRLLAQALRTA